MFTFKNTTWSSIRPTPDTSSTNMKIEGVFTIKEFDPISGVVQGIYKNVSTSYEVEFQGTINSFGDESYVFRFHYDYEVQQTKWKRLYEGKHVANDGNVRIVVGRWQNFRLRRTAREHDDSSSEGLTRQEEGVWVATKP